MSIFASMPLQWKEAFKWQSVILFVNDNNPDCAVSKSSLRRLYWELVEKIAIAPISKPKYEVLFPKNDLPWADIYMLPRAACVDSKTREFQYKLLDRVIPWALLLHPYVFFVEGQKNPSSIILFLYCEFVKRFWLSVTESLKAYVTNFSNLSAFNIIFGFLRKDFKLINHIILLGKQVIFRCRSLKLKPSLLLLLAKVKIVYQLELFIAKRKDSLQVHEIKWEALLPLFLNQ